MKCLRNELKALRDGTWKRRERLSLNKVNPAQSPYILMDMLKGIGIPFIRDVSVCNDFIFTLVTTGVTTVRRSNSGIFVP